MKKRMNKIFIITAVFACVAGKALACTGITLKSGDGANILARTRMGRQRFEQLLCGGSARSRANLLAA